MQTKRARATTSAMQKDSLQKFKSVPRNNVTTLLWNGDRDFLSELWAASSKKLGVELLYSTAYHPQTDGMSGRNNQLPKLHCVSTYIR